MAKIATKKVTADSVTFVWADESTPTTIKLSELKPELVTRAALHGISQKGGDSYSQCTTIAEAKANLQATLDAFKQGDWNRSGTASGGVWVEAIAAVMNQPVEAILVQWAKKTDAEQAAAKKHPEVMAAKAKIDAARAASKAKAAKKSDAPAFTL